MDRQDLTDGWYLNDDFEEVVIEGPGGLEIALRAFDRRLLEYSAGLGSDLLGDLQQRSWRYPVEQRARGDDADLWLELISTWFPSRTDQPVLHILQVGQHVTWHLSDSVGGRLQNWFAEHEEHRAG